MIYCKKCGSELKGAKKYCTACGARQPAKDRLESGVKSAIPEKKKKKVDKKEEDIETGECYRCGALSERTCFFCENFICKGHIKRMQANAASYVDMQHYIKHSDKLRINQGWRGYIIYACPRCASIRHGRDLTDEETEKIRTIDICAWYPIDICQ
jgi:hypothetical protein